MILLNISMPNMNGLEFRRAQLQLLDPTLARVPVVVLTALPDYRRYISELGAMDALQKPVDLDELVKLVQQIGSSRD